MTLLLVAGLVVVVALAWIVSQWGSGSPAAPQRGADQAESVETLAARGDTIAAIKRLREDTGMGLLEAKTAVEGLAQGKSLPPRRPMPIFRGNDDPANDPGFRALLARGEEIAAIRRYRELTGLGLKESKDAVDRLRMKG